MPVCVSSPSQLGNPLSDYMNSVLHQLSLPGHALLRTLPTPLSLRLPGQRGQSRIVRGHCDLCEQGRLEGRRDYEED
jgi:hypothetical protein